MKKYNSYLQVNAYKIRSEMLDGKKQIVIPVVMLVEGVHIGSAGAILHRAEEFSKHIESWNGRPATIGHPEVNGAYVSANQPNVTEANTVGRIYNANVDGNKLKGEIWLDELKLKKVSPLAYAYIVQERPLDVSVGVFSDDEQAQGQWGSENYVAIAKNYRPDHLALLPNEKGACSWNDGCGIRNNANSLSNIASQIEDFIYKMDTTNIDSYLEDVFDDGTFVYATKDKSTGERKFYLCKYAVNADGSITIDSANKQEVQKQVKYIKNNKGGSENEITKKKNSAKASKNLNEGGGTMKEKVEKLFAAYPCVYKTEDDKAELLKLDENVIDKMLVQAEVMQANIEKAKDNSAKDGSAKDVQVNEDIAIKMLKEKISDMKVFAEMLPSDLKRQFEYGQKLYSEHRAKMVDHIMANQASKVWDEEMLKGLDDVTLGKIAQSIKEPANYAGLGDAKDNSQMQDILLPLNVLKDKKKEE